MEEKRIIVGTDNFEKFILDNGDYVDKTELIYELASRAGIAGNRLPEGAE